MFVGFTSVISPAPAEISASFTAFVVGTERGSSPIDADVLKNAAVPKVRFPIVPPEPLINVVWLPLPNADKFVKVIPWNVGESADCKPVSTSVCVPFIVALTVPCDGELNVELETIPLPSVIWVEPLTVPLGSEDITCAEPLITSSTFNLSFTLLSEYWLILE